MLVHGNKGTTPCWLICWARYVILTERKKEKKPREAGNKKAFTVLRTLEKNSQRNL